jgi:AcrR family transcriptional regulator
MRQKQIDESIQMILTGFFKILSEKPYESIRMNDISNAALVSRMTLYRYFKNKDEIATFYIKQIIVRFNDMIKKFPVPNFKTALFIRNKLIYDDLNLRLVFHDETLEVIFREVIKQSEPLIQTFIPHFDDVSNYVKLFISGGISHITKDWVKRGMIESPEHITLECIKLLVPFRQVVK